MFLNRLELTNFGGHKHLLINDLGPVVGLLGPNGSGKSTVLYALEYLIRGEVSLDKKEPMETFVRNWGCSEGASNAVIEGEWVDQGTRWVLTRQFGKTSKRQLKAIDGPLKGQSYTKADIVTRVLGEMFGADLQLSGPAVFLKQGSLHKMLFGTDAEREELFVKLLNVQQVVKNVDVVDECRSKFVSGIQDLTQAIDDARVAWERSETERRDQGETFSKIPDFSPDLRSLSELQEAQGNMDRATATVMVAVNELREIEDRNTKLLAEYGNQKPEELSALLETLLVQSQTYSNAIEQVVNDRALRSQQQQAIADRKDLIAKIAEDTTSLSGRVLLLSRMPSPSTLQERQDLLQRQLPEFLLWRNAQEAWSAAKTSTFEYVEPEFKDKELRAEIEKQQGEVSVLKESVKILSSMSGDACSCSVCGADKAHWARSLESAASLSRTLEAQLAVLRADHLQQLSTWTTWYNARQMHVNNLHSKEASFARMQSLYPWAMSFNYEESSKELDVIKAQREKIADMTTTVTVLENTLFSNHSLSEALAKQIAQLDVSLAGRPDRDIAGVQQILDNCNASVQTTRQTLVTLKSSAEAVSNKQVELQAKNQARDVSWQSVRQIQGKLSDTAISFMAKHANSIPEVINELRSRQQIRDEAAGAFNSATRAAEENRGRLELLEQSRSRNAAKQVLGQELQMLRQVFMRQGLPMTYVNYRFRRLALVTASYMQDIDNDLQVVVDDERSCAFKFRRRNSPEGLWFPQEKMSGGQRVRLCVAFSFAMQRLILPKLGFLTLDEPSTHLDELYVPLLADLLASIGTKLKNTNSQIWVTDHHRELTRAFSNVVTFKSMDTA